MTSNDEYVLQILMENNVVSDETVSLAAAKMKGDGLSVVDILVRDGMLSDVVVMDTVARAFGMEFVDISQVEFNNETRELLPGELAKKFKVVPLYESGNTLTVAMADPMNFETLDGLRYALNRDVEGVIAPVGQIIESLGMLYPEQDISEIDSIIGAYQEAQGEEAAAGGDVGLEEQLGVSDAGEADAPIVKLCAQIIMRAFLSRASDIHLEPMGNRFRVRFRIDDVLHKQESPPRRLQGAIMQRFHLMANMKLSEKRIPQDGRIQYRVKDR